MRPLGLSRIDEPQVRDNFKILEDELKSSPVMNGEWRLFDREFLTAGTYRIFHRLGYKPLDMITTQSTATFTLDWSKVDDKSLELNVTVGGRVRFILGRMK